MAQLEAREKTLVATEKAKCDAFASFEMKSHMALRFLYGEGYKEPLVTPDDGLPGLLAKLIEELENIAATVVSIVEGECRTLFTTASTRVLSHLHLLYPSLDLGTLLEPVAPESRVVAVESVKEQVEALVVKFRCINPEALAKATAAPSRTRSPRRMVAASEAEGGASHLCLATFIVPHGGVRTSALNS